MRVRFAPSPTGKMHIGHLRAALPNALVAKAGGGRFVLRFEDTDVERQVEGAEDLFIDALTWLGIPPDESIRHGGEHGPYNTQARHDRGDYQKAVAQLMAAGRAYECFTSPEELDLMRKLQRSRNEPPRYDNRHRNLTDAQKEAFRQEGRQPVIRFKLLDGEIRFKDLVRGEQSFMAQNLGGDPVIVRSNGTPLFTLGGVVDDIHMEITHVIRGEDHVANTAQQVQIFEALGADLPIFAHLPLMLDAEGHKMSKRLGALTIEQLQAQGILPMALLAYMAGLGFSEQAPTESLEALSQWYDMEGISKAPVRFDEQQLLRTNATLIHKLSYEEVKPYLSSFLPAEAFERARLPFFWEAARENIETLAEISEQYDIVFGSVSPDLSTEDQAYVHSAASDLPEGELSSDTWQAWTGKLKEKTGRKGKALFMPLRLALTGREHGPDMGRLLPLIGQDVVRERLERC